MSSVTLSNLIKEYDGNRVVESLDLTVPDGKLYALLGPSGCGKTTTLRMVAGFIAATSGRIAFGNDDVTRLPPHRRNCGMVFQSYALFPHMTVFDNVAYGLEMRRVPAHEIKQRVSDALDRVRLGGFADRHPRQLSGGQQQRVALARAIVIRPNVLLLDEPLSNLDAKLRHLVRNEIRQLQLEFGLTTIFVTHDQEEALSISDRLVVMNAGRIEQVGSAAELYDTPQTRFVADFIGKSNFLEGAFDGSVFTTADGSRFAVPDGVSEGRKMVLAIKPERIGMSPLSAVGDGNTMRGKIENVNFIGPFTEYHVRSGAERIVIHASRTGPGGGITYQPGQEIALVCPPEACRLVAV